nr:global transcription factor group B1 [Tanacetum cinerariifolium]
MSLRSLLDACDNVAKIFMGSDNNSEWRPVVSLNKSMVPSFDNVVLFRCSSNGRLVLNPFCSKAEVEISYEPCVRRHVRSIFMDCAMVSTRPTADGRVSIDTNHEFAAIVGKHGINVMMVPRFSPDSNVAEVEEQIKMETPQEKGHGKASAKAIEKE